MILVAGSTGSLGGQITRGLLERERPIRILVRPGSGYQPLVDAGAVPVIGDLKDRRSLDLACRGIDTVITTAISLGRGGADTIETVDLAGNRNLVTAAAEAGVRHFVFTSLLGAAPDSPNPFIAAKATTENVVASAGMAWTILAPNAFMDVWLAAVVAGPALAGGEVVYVGSGARRHSFVHSRDVATFALAALDHPAAFNRYLPIGGPHRSRSATRWRRSSVSLVTQSHSERRPGSEHDRPAAGHGGNAGDAGHLRLADGDDRHRGGVRRPPHLGGGVGVADGPDRGRLEHLGNARGTPGERPGSNLSTKRDGTDGRPVHRPPGPRRANGETDPLEREVGRCTRRVAALATAALLLVAFIMPGPATATGGGGGRSRGTGRSSRDSSRRSQRATLARSPKAWRRIEGQPVRVGHELDAGRGIILGQIWRSPRTGPAPGFGPRSTPAADC